MDSRPGPSKEEPKNMTLAEYLSLPENKDANLVMPLPWCPHLNCIGSDEDETCLKNTANVSEASCESCGHIGENWICLHCFGVFCSRYVNEHMLIHGLEKEHVMTLSFADISVWCYACSDYIDNDEKLYGFKNLVHRSKFNEEMPKKEAKTVLQLS